MTSIPAHSLRPGDKISPFGLPLTVLRATPFAAIRLSHNFYLPACVLIEFVGTDKTLSVEPGEKVRLCTAS
jgi:hypothetical protein